MVKALPIMLLIMSAITFTHANSATQDLNAEQLTRYQILLKEFRCLVCQNQSLADSNAELAGDLRTAVLEMVRSNTPDKEIYAFMTDRYGDFVLYRPPFNLATALLWLTPFFVLLVTLAGVFLYIRKMNHRASNPSTKQEL